MRLAKGQPENSGASFPISKVPILFFFLPHLWHVEVLGPAIEPVPQQQPKTLEWQHRILNPLCHTLTLIYYALDLAPVG